MENKLGDQKFKEKKGSQTARAADTKAVLITGHSFMPSIKPLKTPAAFSVKQNLKEMQIGFLEIHEANGDGGKRYSPVRLHVSVFG